MAILSILREFGSGATEISARVADLLEYELVDRKRIHSDLVGEGPKWQEWAKAFDEHYPTVWEKNDRSFRGYVALIQGMIYNYARKDNVLFIGLGAGFLMRAIPYVLQVRIEADLDDRIARIQGDDVVNRETVKWLIEKADSEMEKGMYIVYGRKWDDPAEYDMVLNTSRESKEKIAAKIVDALREKEKLKTPMWQEAVELRAQAARIKAVLATDPSLVIAMLDVEPKEEGLAKYGFVLHAVVYEQDDVGKMEAVSKDLAGDLPIECHIHYRMYPRLR
jgi:cytidylate kinase